MHFPSRGRGVDTEDLSQYPLLYPLASPMGEVQQVTFLAEPRMYMPVFLTALRLHRTHD